MIDTTVDTIRERQQLEYRRETLNKELEDIPARLAEIGRQVAQHDQLIELRSERAARHSQLFDKRLQVLQVEQGLNFSSNVSGEPDKVREYVRVLNDNWAVIEELAKGSVDFEQPDARLNKVVAKEEDLRAARPETVETPLAKAAYAVIELRAQLLKLTKEIEKLKKLPQLEALHKEQQKLKARQQEIPTLLTPPPPCTRQAAPLPIFKVAAVISVIGLAALGLYFLHRSRSSASL